MKDVRYTDLALEPYLSNDTMSIREKKFLYLLRVRMTNVGHNFGNQRECQVCELPGTEDNQEHA